MMGSEANEAADTPAMVVMMGLLLLLLLLLLLQDGSRVGVVQFPHMLLEIEVAAKALAAQPARKRLLVVVSVHVESQIVDLERGVRHGRVLLIIFNL